MRDTGRGLAENTEMVIVAAPDMQGRLVGRRIPADTFDSICREGVAVSTCIFGWDIAQDSTLIENQALQYTGVQTGMGDCHLIPDMSTLRTASWLPHTAIVLADSTEIDGSRTSIAPRQILRRQVKALADLGFEASIGIELEYFMFDGTPNQLIGSGHRELHPATSRPADYSILEGDALEPILSDLRRKLLASEIGVEASQLEWGLGQLETTLRHTDPLEMADQACLYKLAVKSHAAANSMTATFMAKPQDGQPGSSCHVHLSLRALDGEASFWDPDQPFNMSATLGNAIAGALGHAPELMAWYGPTVNSYRRIRGTDAAGWGQTWAFDNRFVTVRVVGHTPESIRLEFRLPGADTNPYLTVAGILASVRDGIASRTKLDPAATGNPYEHPPGDIPQHLGDATSRFQNSEWVRTVFGQEVRDHYGTVLGFEWDQFLDSVTDWERHRYFDTI